MLVLNWVALKNNEINSKQTIENGRGFSNKQIKHIMSFKTFHFLYSAKWNLNIFSFKTYIFALLVFSPGLPQESTGSSQLRVFAHIVL
jgi:hypothetical protein